jgi:hypothetical protein
VSMVPGACGHSLTSIRSTSYILRCAHPKKPHTIARLTPLRTFLEPLLYPLRSNLIRSVRTNLKSPSCVRLISEYCVPQVLDAIVSVYGLDQPVLQESARLKYRVRF